MTREEKARVLLATAKAFVDRGPQLQYDQLSMDRDVQITSRRRYTLPPEEMYSFSRRAVLLSSESMVGITMRS